MLPTLIPIDATSLAPRRDAIACVYGAAFGVDRQDSEQFLTNALDRHIDYPGFRGLVAEDQDGAMLGFDYGYLSVTGQWWHELIRPVLTAASRSDWLEDAFEFVELAVHPDFQGQGIGSRLHDALLIDAPGSKALLSTLPGATPASHLYRSRGWVPLVTDFRYFPGGEDVLLMGLDLEAFAARRSFHRD